MENRKRSRSPDDCSDGLTSKRPRFESRPSASQSFDQKDWDQCGTSSGCNSQSGSSSEGPLSSSSHHSSSLKRERSRSVRVDAEGYVILESGDVLRGRYKMVRELGEGSFGKVVECIDLFNDDARVALKILKKSKKSREDALIEIKVLEHLQSVKSEWKHACVQMLEWFDYHGHICIVFELLGLSTYDFLKENDFQPFPMEQIRHMAYQIIQAVHLLHQNELTHTDLKPDNILLVSSDYDVEYYHGLKKPKKILKTPHVKVADFGNASYDHQPHTGIVSTCYYRAPEVILDLGWDRPCDVWSIGCILLEYYLGPTLFDVENHREHLAMMERVLGPIPAHLLEQTRKKKYVRQSQLDWDINSDSGRYVRENYKPLQNYMRSSNKDHQLLFDLIEKMIKFDPAERLTLDQCLQHPFFSYYSNLQH